MPRVESSTVINAPRDKVIAIARDNERYPEYMADMESVMVVERSPDGRRIVSDCVAIVPRFGTRIRWTEEDDWDVAAGISHFRQLKGDYKQFEGTWTFADEGDGKTRFTSVLDYEIEIPLVGPLIKAIVKKAVQDNLDATLAAIKQRSESES